MKWRVTLEIDRDDLVEEDEVLFTLPWTDVVGPTGDVNVLEAEKVEEHE